MSKTERKQRERGRPAAMGELELRAWQLWLPPAASGSGGRALPRPRRAVAAPDGGACNERRVSVQRAPSTCIMSGHALVCDRHVITACTALQTSILIDKEDGT